MIPIKQLLDKIKWDKREVTDSYVLFYHDRIKNKLIPLKYTDIIRIDEGFLVIKRNDEEVNIPLHRIKEVRKDNNIMWQRKQ